jgi:DNA-binding transcriptional MerR regulator/effector-binding domain-containing protein
LTLPLVEGLFKGAWKGLARPVDDTLGSMYSIGEFSRITGMPVKTLRYYHEKGVLIPTVVDDETGYRYYDEKSVERARIIAQLRALDFTVQEIADLLERCDDESDALAFLERRKDTLEADIRRRKGVVRELERIIAREQEAKKSMLEGKFEIEEKSVPAMLIAGVRMKGRYSDCGKGFSMIGRKLGRYISGNALCLYYDGEYREEDADLEACMPLKRAVQAEGISVRELPAIRCVSLIHRGPYETLGRSYERALRHAKEKGFKIALPTREVYVKGPGMIFRGNPKNYVTEIQLPIESGLPGVA